MTSPQRIHSMTFEDYRQLQQEQQRDLRERGRFEYHEHSLLDESSSSSSLPLPLETVEESFKQQQHTVRIQPAPFPQVNMAKFCIVMVGLPARGKSYLSYILTKYLNWIGIRTKVFNVGQYRRDVLGAGQKASFWDPSDPENFRLRENMSTLALADLVNFLRSEGQVAIFDATNTTRARRDRIIQRLVREETDLNMDLEHIIFIESVCTDDKLVNMSVENIKIQSDDYTNVHPEEALKDFLERIHKYEKIYEPMDDEYDAEKTFVTLVASSLNVRERMVLNRISGYLPSKITTLLMNTHIIPRRIFLTRHGESEYNTLGKLGGDSPLSALGECYADILPQFVAQQMRRHRAEPEMVVWTSTLQRTIQTSAKLPFPAIRSRALDEINAGIFDGMTYEEIEKTMPQDWERRKKDKFNYKYPRGESYHDLVNRLDPIIIELERQQIPVCIVSHNAITRVLYAYLTGKSPETCMDIPIPLHTVIEIVPTAYGCREIRHNLEPVVQKLFMERYQHRVPHTRTDTQVS